MGTFNPSDLIACLITKTRMPLPPPDGEKALECVDRHIKDFDGMSKRARLKYNYLRLTQIVCAALVPLLSANGNALWAAGLGVAVVISSSIEVAAQYYDKWIRWRRTWQQLVIERQAYLYQSEEAYKNDENRDANLIKRVNEILSGEHALWHQSSANSESLSKVAKKATENRS